ncbi:hypothetical protein GW17_00059921, partial [Ensete ventricosum]
KGSKEERSATASPHAGPVAQDQPAAKAPCKGGRPVTARASPQGRPTALARGDSRPQGQEPTGAVPAGESAARGHSRLQRGAYMGDRLQDAPKGLPPSRAVMPPARVPASWQSDCRWARAATACVRAAATTTTQRRQEGLGHPF